MAYCFSLGLVLVLQCFSIGDFTLADTVPAPLSSYSPPEAISVDEGKSSKQENAATVTQENSREVLETHHATCKVTTEELVATAQATVTRVLKGLCNAREMEDRFHNLEAQLTERLNAIHTMLVNLDEKVSEQALTSQRGQRRVLGALLKSCPSVAVVASGKGGTSGAVPDQEGPIGELSEEDKDSTTRAQSDSNNGPRDDEIFRYNSTIHSEASPLSPAQPQRVFTYYWRVPQLRSKLANWSPQRSLRSSSFYISPQGYRMYLRIFPRQSGETVYLHVGLTHGDYDGRLSWPFRLRHRVAVLDQSGEGSTEDLLSRLWDPVSLCSAANWQRPLAGDNLECVGLGFPHHVLHQRNYIRSDSLVIKLTVYLQ